jgi:hypothetical protein
MIKSFLLACLTNAIEFNIHLFKTSICNLHAISGEIFLFFYFLILSLTFLLPFSFRIRGTPIPTRKAKLKQRHER